MNRPRPQPPSKDEIRALPPFDGLSLAQIELPVTPEALAQACDELLAQPFVGFDTEARPTFEAGAPVRGPDVVQFALRGKAYVLQLHDAAAVELVRTVLAAPQVVKVGFDLRSDQQQLMHLIGQRARPLLDLDAVFAAQGYPRSIGVKAAVAIVFGRRLDKSKKVATTNWSRRVLDPRQILYAANDAYAAWAVLDALGFDPARLPVWTDGTAPPQPQRRRKPRPKPAADTPPSPPVRT